MRLVDSSGRRIGYLRISVTDRCDLRCGYCLPDSVPAPFDKSRVLTFEEITLVVRVATGLGIRRVRITGGEPLIRRDLTALVRQLRRETELEELALTTNGMRLGELAADLAASGLDRVNVSIDSLRTDRFREITGTGDLNQVMQGVEKAYDAGLRPTRINVVLMDGVNEDEADDWVRFTRDRDLSVRFLELMPIGAAGVAGHGGRFVDVSRLREKLVERHGLQLERVANGTGPAQYWRAPGAQGTVGFIVPVSAPFCRDCNRLRLTAVGELRPCLASDDQVDLAPAIRSGDEEAIAAGFVRAAKAKSPGHDWELGRVTDAPMSKVGG